MGVNPFMDKRDLIERATALVRDERATDPNIGDDELLERIDQYWGAGSLRCDELIRIGLQRIINFDGHGQKWRRCVACDHASADCITDSTPAHTCIHEQD
jgi:hypothetical protein